MKKLLLLTKTLLAVALLCVGQNAWGAAGDVTTNADIDFSSSITGTNPYTISGTVGSMTWTQQWTMAPNITDGILRFGNTNNQTVELQNNTIGAKDVVTIKFDLAFGKLNDKHVGFKFVDKNGTDILTQWFDAYNGDFDNSNPLGLDWSEMYRGSNEVIQERCVNFTITIDYAASTIKTETTCLLSGAGKSATNGSHTVSLPSSTPIGSFVLMGNINNTSRYSTFDNLLIKTTEGDYSTPTANYTVKYQCGGVDIKDADVREGDVDAAIVLLASDKATFNKDEKRYIYVSDDLGTKTVAEDGSTVVTITFREAAKYNYTITSSYEGNALPWSVASSCWEDQNTIKVSYPRYQASGSKLVGLAPESNNLTKSITVTGDDFESDLEYAYESIDNLYLLSEAENLGTDLATNATTYTDRISNRLIIYGSEGTLVNLPAGKYIFTLGVIGGDTGSHKVNYTVSAGATQVASGTCTGNFLTLITSEEFEIPESTDITFTCSDPASGRGIDLVYVQRTGDYTVSKTITSAGWATYCSPYALNFEGVSGLKAYIVKGTVGETTELNIEEVTTVPANEGILLQGTAGEYNIPVVASADPVSGNKLEGVIASQVLNANDGFVLMGSPKVGFYKNANNFTLTANTAYLPSDFAEVTGDARSAYFFRGDITGVDNVEAAAEAKAKEGKFIENGKLVIVKNGQKFNAAGQQVK